MGFLSLGILSFQIDKCFSKEETLFICIISSFSSMVSYQASCACVCAHACSGELHPGKACPPVRRGLPGGECLAICVATTNPMFPSLNAGKETVPLPRPGLSF